MTDDRLLDVRDKRVLVYSMGMEGQDLARWMLRHGASVTMSDTRSDEQLEAANAIAPVGVERTVTGQALIDADGFDVVATSQAMLKHDAALMAVAALGIQIVSQAQLFMRLCKGRVVGITGSSGKSTTTALVGEMARSAGIKHTVGGNIGVPLLDRVESIEPDETVIFEISHTQLQYLDTSPEIAAITNVTPNHLDQFSWDGYVALKGSILDSQTSGSIAVLNEDDEVSMTFSPTVAGELHSASSKAPVRRGAWVDGAEFVAVGAGGSRPLFDRARVPLRGDHNVANVVMACAIGQAMGLPDSALIEAATTFTGVPHRLEIVGTALGATWVNDSIATSPERTLAGLQAFDEPVVLLLGGREKNLSLDELSRAIARRCRAVFTFGEAAEPFAEAARGTAIVEAFVTLAEAVAAAAGTVKPGDVVLMSPAGTSFDAYPNFGARGEEFRTLVRALPSFEPAKGVA